MALVRSGHRFSNPGKIKGQMNEGIKRCSSLSPWFPSRHVTLRCRLGGFSFGFEPFSLWLTFSAALPIGSGVMGPLIVKRIRLPEARASFREAMNGEGRSHWSPESWTGCCQGPSGLRYIHAVWVRRGLAVRVCATPPLARNLGEVAWSVRENTVWHRRSLSRIEHFSRFSTVCSVSSNARISATISFMCFVTPEDLISYANATLTSEEILERFRRLFGRDMTPEEKHMFFIPEVPEAAHKETGPAL